MQSFFFLIRNTIWVVSAVVIVATMILLIALAVSIEIWRTVEFPTEPIPVQLTEQGTVEIEDHVFHPVDEGTMRSLLGRVLWRPTAAR